MPDIPTRNIYDDDHWLVNESDIRELVQRCMVIITIRRFSSVLARLGGLFDAIVEVVVVHLLWAPTIVAVEDLDDNPDGGGGGSLIRRLVGRREGQGVVMRTMIMGWGRCGSLPGYLFRRFASAEVGESSFAVFISAMRSRKLTDEMAVELTEVLRSDERKLADPSGACLAAAMIPRAFLAVELPDMEVESMASITKVVTLEEVKTLLQGLLEEGDAQQLRRRLSMEAAVRAVAYLRHSGVEVTERMLEGVLQVHQAALTAVLDGDMEIKEFLKELAESMKTMKYFSKVKVAREGFLPYYQRAVAAITKADHTFISGRVRLRTPLRVGTVPTAFGKVLAEVAPVELAAVMVTELDETKILGGLRESQLPSVVSVWMQLLALPGGHDSRLLRLADLIASSESATLGDMCRAWAALGACDETIVTSTMKTLSGRIKTKLSRELEPRHVRLMYDQ
ncbi:hypothetical protein Pmar_PMAR016132 [Perkinsus marinus ATCC 50983]|uniref:Uncharacterized protein n=1 Tax=Perkinsus marinus (strain ATCC 50983 / TXsc) TaxID=423536 RepID=C5LZ45_PERM5|nr:hypothetical protein Pmar_PMAR016132 [Perkinsus marinus ATCC 50983]EEQ98054.1 hypothetical protein Pmar_PMAR016132 [Perkinsus marinus ATCC 50983]|eukprot:XP_002765337.1 hypothetical protein Pmar_PMAR016132 [Perkinsus marinus ATCC 50983]